MAIDAIMAPVWVACNLFLLWAGWRTSRLLVPDDGPLLKICQVVLFWWGTLVLAGLTVGAPGLLTGPRLLLASLIYGAILVAAATGAERFAARRSSCSSFHGTDIREGSVWFEEPFWFTVWGVWLSWMVSRIVLVGLLGFPREWDTLMYHLPLVDQWLRAGSLFAPDDAVWYNPASFELIGLWLVAPFSGDFLVGLVNFPMLLLLPAVGVELGREFGLGRRLSHVFSFALTSNYVVFRQALEAKNDIAVLALFLTVVVCGLRFVRKRRLGHLAYTAAAFGLLCGVKYFAVGYAAVALAIVVVVCLLAPGGRKAAWSLVGAAALGAMLLAGYWYARNFWVTGTPTYPFGFTGDTDVILDVRPELWETTLLGNRSPGVAGLLAEAVHSMMGPCNLAAYLLIPILLAWLMSSGVYTWFVAGSKDKGVRRLALAGLLLGCGLVFGLTPFAVETVPGTMNMLRGRYLPVRFGLCFLSLGLLALTLLLQDVLSSRRWVILRQPWRAILSNIPLALFGLVGVWQFYVMATLPMKGNTMTSVLVAANIFGVGLLLYALHQLSRTLVRTWLMVTAVALFAATSWGSYQLARHWHAGFVVHYDELLGGGVFRMLEQTDPVETRICVLGDRYYPFFGSRRQFAASRASYLQSREQAVAYLQQQRPTFVATLSRPSTTAGVNRFDRCGGWLLDHPEVFRPVAIPTSDGASEYRLFKVNQIKLEQLQKDLTGSAAVTTGTN